MSPERWLLFFQVLAGLLGVLTPVAIYVMGRKAQVRKLNTASDVDVATVKEKDTTAQDLFIQRLQDDRGHAQEIITRLETKLERMEARQLEMQQDFADRLGDAHTENVRLRTQVVQLTTDLDIAQRQNADYRQRYYGGGLGGP